MAHLSRSDVLERPLIHSALHCVTRDIKPGNILINKGEVKLADFGASKRLDEELLSQTEEGIAGTVIYM
eukprot:52324-Eustigmatos_ZCMA.PRE.1